MGFCLKHKTKSCVGCYKDLTFRLHECLSYRLHHGDQVVTYSASGPSAKASEEDQERTRRLADAEMHRHHLESLLDQRDREINALREVMSSPTMGDVTLHFFGLVMFFSFSYILIWNCTCSRYFTHTCQHVLHLTQQELHRRYEGTPESTKTKALQTVIDMKVRI